MIWFTFAIVAFLFSLGCCCSACDGCFNCTNAGTRVGASPGTTPCNYRLTFDNLITNGTCANCVAALGGAVLNLPEVPVGGIGGHGSGACEWELIFTSGACTFDVYFHVAGAAVETKIWVNGTLQANVTTLSFPPIDCHFVGLVVAGTYGGPECGGTFSVTIDAQLPDNS